MKYISLFFILLISCSLLAQSEEKNGIIISKMELFVADNLGEGHMALDNPYFSNYQELIRTLATKQAHGTSDARFLKQIFYSVHKKILGTYEQYVTFDALFQNEQKYDCVTGTALYALILDHFGFDYDIHETDYHVYLVAYAQEKRFLFEATDPIYGFSSNSDEIDQRMNLVNLKSETIIKDYLKGIGSEDEALQNIKIIDNIVTLSQLSGLHYYNQGLKYFNKGNYKKAFQMSIKAQGIYPSQRIKNASSFIFSMAFED